MLKKGEINPYRIGASLILRKLYFDIRTNLFNNRKKISRLKGAYSDKKCIIICNGPSLNLTDFNQLSDSGIYTIGLNKINLLFEKFSFRPDLIVSVNSLVIEQNKDFFISTEIPILLDFWSCKDARIISEISSKKNKAMLYSSDSTGRFASDISSSINQGCTVTFVALQVAYYMGFTKVGLIGCDHNFATKGRPNLTVVQKGNDDSHFDPNYFGDGVKWQLPDLIGSEYHYQIAKDAFERDSRFVYNCSIGGKLEIFNRLSIEDFLKL